MSSPGSLTFLGKIFGPFNWWVPTVDGGFAQSTSRGLAGVPFTSANQSGGVANVTAAPDAGQKLVIVDLIVSVDTDMTVTFKEETTGTMLIGPVYMAAKSTINLLTRGKRKLPTANKKLQVLTSAAGNISVEAGYFSEA